ncbi:MAG: hypothetical protein OXQ28_12915 [Acidobacteriota bacterium]|nr:hypothetical protein [Acidobacteriota bacterium]
MMHAAMHALLFAGFLVGQERALAAQGRDIRPDGTSESSGEDADLSNRALSYDSGGRRDPFLAPPARGRPDRFVGARPRGLAGIAVEEMTLRGLVRLGDEYLAMLETEHGRSHVVRGGEELFDGYVQSVAAGGVVIVVDGPRGAARAVRLTLRSSRGEP